MDLHGLVRGTLGGLRGVQLAHRSEHTHLVRSLGAAVRVADGGPIHHRARELGLHRHVRELELDRLVLGDGDTERTPLLRVCERCVEARLRYAHRKRCNGDAAAHQGVEELPVPATALAE